MANGFQSREIAPEAVSGLNLTGSTILKGTILAWSSVGVDRVVPSTSATDAFAGVAGEDIPNGHYGRVIRRGTAPVIFAAAQTIGARVTAGTGGKAVAAAAGNAVLGIAREAGGEDVLAEVELAGPGGLEMPGAED